MLVLYHDDFDGLASAALVNAFLHQHLDIQVKQFIPVNYHLKEDWLKPSLPLAQEDDVTIVDFLYHPDAWLYFDHHGSAFLTPEYQEHYDNRALAPLVLSRQTGEELSYWSTDYGSCGQLIFEWLRVQWPAMGAYRALANAADMIDQARYPSVEAYFDAKDPAIALNHVYPRISDGQKSELIRQLETQTLDQVLETVRTEADAAIRANHQLLHRYELLTELRGAVAFTNLWNTDTPFVRYAPYYHAPGARYTVTIHFPHAGEAAISLGRNPWKKGTYNLDLGQLAQRYGGGGHPYAAGISFLQSDWERPHQIALKVANELISTLQDESIPVAA